MSATDQLSLRPAPPPIILADAWRRYKATGDRRTRNELVLAYSPVVKYVAGLIAARMPAHIDLADLVSYGLGGLINAVERFDPARGIKFEYYARTRIRGAILDELRSQDWVPRTVRAEARRLEQATDELSARMHRTPTDAELAAKLSMDSAQLQALLKRVADAGMVALDEPRASLATGEPRSTLLEALSDPDAVDPAERAHATVLRERIADAITHLPEREQLVLGLRYHQGMRLGEIGEILGVSESRVCQLHIKAVIDIRALIGAERLTAASAEGRAPRTAQGPRRR